MVKVQDGTLNGKGHENPVKDPSKLFDSFVHAQTCHQIFSTFHDLCRAIDLQYPPSPCSSPSSDKDYSTFYVQLKKKLSASWRAQTLWAKLDKRFFAKEYFVNPKLHKSGGRRIAEDLKVLIIGAGPCGLRTAIEMACLGAKTVVVEKRDVFSRNNILHLWPFIITDLKSLGAKKFYGRFCAGAIDHISIRQLQIILLKISLLVGVEVVVNVSFQELLPPLVMNDSNVDHNKRWTALLNPENHPVSKFEFNVVIGADGKRNTLQGFKRKEFRGKLAIGLTVNFINRNTTAEAKVEEISGVAYIFNQQFFKDLRNDTGIDLENIVYYKGETHYFVMTAKKHSLVSKGVLKQDYDDIAMLLSYENVDRDAMMSYARQAADFSTRNQLPNLDFAINQYGQPDIALFDFTCMYAAENASHFREVKKHKLLSCLVGDSLLEPFWPMGTGCARGFLAAFDAVWMTRQWALKQTSLNTTEFLSNSVELEVLAQRESIYRLLHQTTPQNTANNLANYTIDPSTRYRHLNKPLKLSQVTPLYLSDREIPQPTNDVASSVHTYERRDSSGNSLTRKVSIVRSSKLLTWCQRMTEGYHGVRVFDMTSSWKSGLALCAIIHRYRPDLINWNDLKPSDIEGNNQLAFDVAENHLGISPVMTGKDMSACNNVDKLIMVTYISQFYEMFKHETPCENPQQQDDSQKETLEVPLSPTGISSTSPVGLLTRFTQHIKRRSLQGKHEESQKKKKKGIFKKKNNAESSDSNMTVQKENDENKNEINNENDVDIVVVETTQVKLRPKKEVDGQANKPGVNQRASNRISELSNQLISQWEQNSPLATPRMSKVPDEVTEISEQRSSDKCYFCNKRVYIVERLSAEGLFFHRQCFVCSNCGVTLRHGNYEFVSKTGCFFCRAHYFAHSDAFQVATDISTQDIVSTKPEQHAINIPQTDGVKLRKKLEERSYRTPERIELENMRLSMIHEPKELSEEILTQHNNLSTIVDEEKDSSQENMSESSDDDSEWDDMMGEVEGLQQSGDDEDDEDDILSDRRRVSKLVKRRTLNNLNASKSFNELNSTKFSVDCNENVKIELGEEMDAQSTSDDCVEDSESDERTSTLRPIKSSAIRTRRRLSVDPRLFNDMFESVKVVDESSSVAPRECVFLSVDSSELQRKERRQSAPTHCKNNYIPKNELLVLSKQLDEQEIATFKEETISDAIQGWLSGLTFIQDAINAGKKLLGELSSCDETESQSSDDEPELKNDEISSSSCDDEQTNDLVTKFTEVLEHEEESQKVIDDVEVIEDAESEDATISKTWEEKRDSLSSSSTSSHLSVEDDSQMLPPSHTNNEDEFIKLDDLPDSSDLSRNMNKLDTLDRAHQYLRSTPLTIDQTIIEGNDEVVTNRDNSHVSSISSNSSFSSISGLSDVDVLTLLEDEKQEPVLIDRVLNKEETNQCEDNAESMNQCEDNAESTNAEMTPVRTLQRPPSVSSILIKASNIGQNNTSVWTNIEDDSTCKPHCDVTINESIISEYKSTTDCEKPPQARKLSYDSLERRMKSRLQVRNKWLHQEDTKQISTRESEALRSPPAPAEDLITPTAPPKCLSPSFTSDNDQFFTPVAKITINEDSSNQPSSYDQSLQLETSDVFLSPMSTPVIPSCETSQPTSRRLLPMLPKVPHLEAISPTAPSSVSDSIDEDFKAREERVKERVSKLKTQSLLRRSKTENSPVLDESNQEEVENPSIDESCEIVKATYSGSSPKPKRKNFFRNKHRKHNKQKQGVDEGFRVKRALPVPLFINESKSDSQDSNIRPQPPNTSVERKKKFKFKRSKTRTNPVSGSSSEAVDQRKHKNSKSLFSHLSKTKLSDDLTLDKKHPIKASENDKAMLRGERVRLLPETPSSLNHPEAGSSRRHGSHKRHNTLAGLTPAQIDAKITRRVQIAARRQAKMEAQKRLRRAQVIQRQLEEVEVKQKDLEERGVCLEKLIRNEEDQKYREDSKHMQEWFGLVQEKNGLLRYENELMIYQRELQLEDVQSRLQQELRERMAMDDTRKTSAQLAQEKEILQKMLEVVEQRDELVGLLEEQRLKERDETVDPETLMLNKFNTFSDDSLKFGTFAE